MSRNWDAVITEHRITVTSIGSIWTQQVRVHVHAQDMVHSSHTVWSIFRKESGGYIRHHEKNDVIYWVIGKLISTTQSARPWSDFRGIYRHLSFMTYVVSGAFISDSAYQSPNSWSCGIPWKLLAQSESGTSQPTFWNAFRSLRSISLRVPVRLKVRFWRPCGLVWMK